MTLPTSPGAELFWMRSAGFPFELLDALNVLCDGPALAQCEALIDRIHATEAALLATVAQGAPAALPKLQRKLAEASALSAADMPAGVREATADGFAQRTADLACLNAAMSGLQDAFTRDQARNRRHLVAALSSAQAREALFLSNPESLQRVEALNESFAEPLPNLDSRTRQRLRLAWNYLQRLCAKNDTSSFFGPITWGRIDRQQDAPLRIEAPPGDWLAQRETFFEHWVLLRLSQAVCADGRLASALPIVLSPGCHLRGDMLHYPLAKRRRLEGAALSLMRLMGETGPHGAAPRHRQALLAALAGTGHAEQVCDALIGFFLDKGVLQYQLEVPPSQTRQASPMQLLRERIAALPAPADALRPWLGLIDDLDTERRRFAAGDLPARRASLDALGALLAAHGIDLSRAQGKMYVGRFPVYEDCGRNLRVSLGAALVEALERPLDPVLALHHWLAGAVAVRMHDRCQQIWHGLRRDADTVDFLQFYQALQQQGHGDALVQEFRALLQQAWQGFAAQHPQTAEAGDEIRLTPQDLSELLAGLQACEPRAEGFPGIAWRVHSPDVMLAARDADAVAQGDYAWVIGEIHPAVHTLSQPVAQPFCPDGQAIRHEVAGLLSPATAVLADSPQTYQRSHIDWLEVDPLYQVLLPGSIGGVPPERCLPAGRGEVVSLPVGSRDVLHYRDTATGFVQDLLTVIPTEVHRACFALAADLLGHVLTARLVCDRLILKRRCWNITPQELPPPGQPAEDLRSHLAWRQWARQRGMPRHVFAKLAGEPKPIYVDFANPLSLDLLANLCKTPQALRISEMRPAPDELWLRDARGRYCSEFRTSYVAKRPAQGEQRGARSPLPADVAA